LNTGYSEQIMTINLSAILPEDGTSGTLLGRVWLPAANELPAGPAPVVVRGDGVYDLSSVATTSSGVLELDDPAALIAAATDLPLIASLTDIAANSVAATNDQDKPSLLAPVDLQAIKAAGVTFVKSMLERVIEEQAKGDPTKAAGLRETINAEVGSDLAAIKPGSEDAERVKQILIQRGMWSQYLEVGIGPYAEVFTKSQPLSAVGPGADVGLHPESTWNNPEPEVVMVVNSQGQTVGATLGNDVNLRDFEGRSALLLGKAKDNNASCSLGPFIRLFDDTFSIEDVRQTVVKLNIEAPDGYVLNDSSSLSEISRDPLDLVSQTIGDNHQYPDGVVLFTGTMFAPVQDRDGPGQGFTHKLGDVVTISSEKMGALSNTVTTCDQAARWTFGIGALMQNLAARGLL
jgi:fumarylacetoacetate (FAA) hydrolase family protein